MSRKNQGFLLAESLIVATFVVSLLIFLFAQFKNLSTSYDDVFKYNSVEGLYALDNVRTYLKENTRKDMKLSTTLNSSADPYITIFSEESCNASIGLSGLDYCEELMKAQNIKSVIFTKASLKEIGEMKPWLRSNNYGNDDRKIISENMKNFILMTDESSEFAYTYRLIAEFNDGSYATFNVGDENWDSSKYKNPDYVEPSYNVGIDETCFEPIDLKAGGVEITDYTCSDVSVKVPSEIGGKRVYSIGESAFKQKGITSLTLPAGIKTIGTNAFSGNSITSLTIPESVISIGSYAFADNSLTGELKIPDMVSSVQSYAFSGNEIQTLSMGINLSFIGSHAFFDNSISTINFNNALTTVESNAFAENSLTSISLPATLTTIGDGAFWNNSIANVTIPESVQSIGDNAFSEKVTWSNVVINGEAKYRFNASWTEIGWPISKLTNTETFTTTDTTVYNAPLDGYYRIDLWGAQGGNANCASSPCGVGGKGGYTTGIAYLEAGTKLYVTVGAKGANATASLGAGGGEATDIRIETNDLKSRIMVAGGGGGASGTNDGGFGGGLWGGNYQDPVTLSTPAKQTSGYEFGVGASASATSAGGGGGYYGGNSISSGGNLAGSGGSSFISGHAGSNALNSEGEHTNQAIHMSGTYFVKTKMANGISSMPDFNLTSTTTGHEGNGAARITYAGTSAPKTSSLLNEVRYIRDCISGYDTNTTNHWMEVQAISSGDNVAYKKVPTLVSGSLTSAEKATDGKIDSFDDFASVTGTSQCLQIDLEDEYNLEEIAIWHNFLDARKYNSHIVSVKNEEDDTYRSLGQFNINETADGIRIR